MSWMTNLQGKLTRSQTGPIPLEMSEYSSGRFHSLSGGASGSGRGGARQPETNQTKNLTGNERMRIRSSLKCGCPNKTFHTPKELVVDIDEYSDPEFICSRFPPVNRFIAEARKNGAHILMFSPNGKNACQAMAIQYIMQYHKMSLDHAIHYFKSTEEMVLSDNMIESLRLWEVQLQNATTEVREVRSADSRRTDWVQGNRPMSVDSNTMKRIAWE